MVWYKKINFDIIKKKCCGKLNVKYDNGFVINVCVINIVCNVVLIKKYIYIFCFK